MNGHTQSCIIFILKVAFFFIAIFIFKEVFVSQIDFVVKTVFILVFVSQIDFVVKTVFVFKIVVEVVVLVATWLEDYLA